MIQLSSKYTVVRQLGSGGMADVYLARLRGIGGFDKQVVVKRIRADLKNDATFIDMFLDEARLAANLNHSNVVQIFEVDQVDGLPFIAMEYIHGPTLALLLQRLPEERGEYGHIAYLMAGVAAGLAHAHNASDPDGNPLNIVHRDISPQNIIISFDGNAKLFDFGVAKARGSLSTTSAGSIKGKVAYMAPEQLRSHPVDSRADIYAFGVCLYEATLGRRPFRGHTEGELFAARVEGAFPRPSELINGYPPDLEMIVLAAMAANPEDRPSAWELHRALLTLVTRGVLASNPRAVADWLAEVMPDDGSSELAADAYASAGKSGGASRSGKRRSVEALTGPQDPRRTRKVVVIAAATTLTLALGVGIYLAVRPTAPTASTVAALPPAPPAPKLDVAPAPLAPPTAVAPTAVAPTAVAPTAVAPTAVPPATTATATVATAVVSPPVASPSHPSAATVASPRRDPAPASGRLTVKTRSGASVFIDNELVDRGSFAHRPLANGEHVVAVRMPGFASASRTVVIQSGREASLTVTLSPVAAPARPDSTATATTAPAPAPSAPAAAAATPAKAAPAPKPVRWDSDSPEPPP